MRRSEEVKESVEVLNEAAGYIRSLLAKRITCAHYASSYVLFMIVNG